MATGIIDLQNTPPPDDWGVAVDIEALHALADQWAGTTFDLPSFDYPGTPANRDEQWWFDYVALAVSVLACLWPPEGDDVWHAESDGQWLDDAPGIFAAFTRRVGPEGIDLQWFADMSAADGEDLFVGQGTLLLIDERVAVLRETAAILLTTWRGSARHLVDSANRDGKHVVRLLSETIPAFDDRPVTAAGTAHFDKLAHLAAAIMAAGQGWATAGFTGYDDFPVYPDYMLPRVFRHYGAMTYHPAIAGAVDSRTPIEKDSAAEHAIRWATVYCGAQLKASLAAAGTPVTGPALDYRLWSIAVLGPDASDFGEHHRTLTMKY